MSELYIPNVRKLDLRSYAGQRAHKKETMTVVARAEERLAMWKRATSTFWDHPDLEDQGMRNIERLKRFIAKQPKR